jgi:SAM-dependent methyltransferase
MNRLFARLGYALRRHGPAGFIWLVGFNVVYHLRAHNRRPHGPAQPDSFDEKYGTDTGGTREIGSLDVLDSPIARFAVRYDPSSEANVRFLLHNLQIDYSRFDFIDFGSGKGRVLLIAAEFPFREVLGIEFSRELHETAVQNLARLPPDVTGAGSVRSIHGDASSFELPRSDLVCYFYNPFGAPVIEAVAARLAAHHERFGFRVIVVYVDPRHAEIFKKSGKFVAQDKNPRALVLTTHPPSGAAAAPDSGTAA